MLELLRDLGPGGVRICVCDEDGWRGTVTVHPRGYVCRVRHLWQRSLGGVLVLRSSAFPAGTLGERWRTIVADFVRRVIHQAEGGIRGEKAVDEVFMEGYPAIHEYLTLDWLEGAVRETATLGVSVDGGAFKVRLADRENGLVTFVSGSTLYGALNALERLLAAGEADWRTDTFAKPRGKGKKG